MKTCWKSPLYKMRDIQFECHFARIVRLLVFWFFGNLTSMVSAFYSNGFDTSALFGFDMSSLCLAQKLSNSVLPYYQ